MSQTKFKPVAEQLEYLKKGIAEIIREDEFVSKLRRSHDTGKPLRAKLGVDPTAPDIHLGHMVVIENLKLPQFFNYNHMAEMDVRCSGIDAEFGSKRFACIVGSSELGHELVLADDFRDALLQVLELFCHRFEFC